MNRISRTLVGTVVAGAVALSAVSPAVARDNGGIGVGEIIAGALIIGGIAAIASSADKGRDYDYRYDRGRYGNSYYGDNSSRDNWRSRDRYSGGNTRQAVEQCVRAAERSATRYSYGNADVTDVRNIRRTDRGFEVRGRIAVNSMGRDWRDGDRTYGRGWNGDYRGWDRRYRGYDAGTFNCRVDYGRVVDLDFGGIRGL